MATKRYSATMWKESSMPFNQPRTAALQCVLMTADDHKLAADLLYLEQWELFPLPGPAAALRVSQIRRANPDLAAAIRREIICSQEFAARNLPGSAIATERQAVQAEHIQS
jgi:hypothetical protein